MAEPEELMAEQATLENNNKRLNWTTEIKTSVVTIDKVETAKGKGFVKRVKKDGIKRIQNTNKQAGRN